MADDRPASIHEAAAWLEQAKHLTRPAAVEGGKKFKNLGKIGILTQ